MELINFNEWQDQEKVNILNAFYIPELSTEGRSAEREVECDVILDCGIQCKATICDKHIFFNDPDLDFNYDETNIKKWKFSSFKYNFSSLKSSFEDELNKLRKEIEKSEEDIKWIKENCVTKEGLKGIVNQLKMMIFHRRGLSKIIK